MCRVRACVRPWTFSLVASAALVDTELTKLPRTTVLMCRVRMPSWKESALPVSPVVPGTLRMSLASQLHAVPLGAALGHDPDDSEDDDDDESHGHPPERREGREHRVLRLAERRECGVHESRAVRRWGLDGRDGPRPRAEIIR